MSQAKSNNQNFYGIVNLEPGHGEFEKRTSALRAPRVLVPTPSAKGGEGFEKDPPHYLKNEKSYKPETFGGVRSIL